MTLMLLSAVLQGTAALLQRTAERLVLRSYSSLEHLFPEGANPPAIADGVPAPVIFLLLLQVTRIAQLSTPKINWRRN